MFFIRIKNIGGLNRGMTLLKNAKEVLYMDKRFRVIHVYNSGYCEIRKINNFYHVELALATDLVVIK
jgi:hypothetical protein